MPKYVFREGHVLTINAASEADPQVLGEALEKISNRTPKQIVQAASDRRSPLHRHFEWDNEICGDNWRKEQARSLIQAIYVPSDKTESGMARAFLSVRDENGISYRTISDVMKSSDLQDRLLKSAERDLLAWEMRYQEISDVCLIVRKARQKVAAKRKQASETRDAAR